MMEGGWGAWETRRGGEEDLMLAMTEVMCPFCGETFELGIDTSVESQRFTTDCEVCCRPMEVVVECEAGEVVDLSVVGG